VVVSKGAAVLQLPHHGKLETLLVRWDTFKSKLQSITQNASNAAATGLIIQSISSEIELTN
jgi:hypothetical protein